MPKQPWNERLTPQVRDRLNSSRRLPVLSDDFHKIIRLLEQPDTPSSKISELISRQQSLAAEVLKIVNSSFYGLKQEVTSIYHATVMLGFSTMRSLVMSHSFANIISGGQMELYHHSMACALASFRIAERIGISEPEIFYTAGLVHDIGKVILATQLEDEFARIQALVAERGCLMIEAEVECIGCDHAAVGAWFLNQWQIPESLTVPVADHHDLAEDKTYAKIAAAVQLADVLIRAQCFGWGGDPGLPALQPQALRILGMDVADVEEVVLGLPQVMESIERCWRTE